MDFLYKSVSSPVLSLRPRVAAPPSLSSFPFVHLVKAGIVSLFSHCIPGT